MDGTAYLWRRESAWSTVTLVGIGLVFALLLYSAVSYPASVGPGGGPAFTAVVGGLVAYGAAAEWVRRRPGGEVRAALARGARIGAALGLVAVGDLALEHFVGGNARLNAVRGVGMWGVLFLAFGAAGSMAADATMARPSGAGGTRPLGLAVLASVWSGLVSAVAMLAAGFALAVLWMSHMTRILAPDFARSGMADPRAFVVRHTVAAAAMHVLLMPVVAAVFGAVGGSAAVVLRAHLRDVRRPAAWSLGGAECALAVGGLAALRWASTLPRSARPPFVMSGLLALGLALACAHAVLRTVRRSSAAI